MKNVIILLLAMLSISVNFAFAQRITVTLAGGGGDTTSGRGAHVTKFDELKDVRVDVGGNIYAVDKVAGKIKKISAATGLVTTIAGGGTSTADGILAINASIYPSYICIDAVGNLYISSDRVRKINLSTGIITTVAGTLTPGYSGDGGPAIAAQINYPLGICIDAAGNIYFADVANKRIRKVTAATGVISTIAGTGVSGYSGDAGPATAATIDNVSAVGVSPTGDVFFSDQGGGRIRRINASTGIITTIAGTGPATTFGSGDGGPATAASVGTVHGIFVNDSGDVYIDDDSCACRKIDMTTGIIKVVAGNLMVDGYNGDGLKSTDALLNFPQGLFIDAANNIYVADRGNGRIRKAIKLTHNPEFAYGAGQYIYSCKIQNMDIDTLLAIVDLDSAQNETWTVISGPTLGSLTGFPFTTSSWGLSHMTAPSGLSYTPASMFTGTDSFKVKVTDGALSDIMTIYVMLRPLDPGTISGPSAVCAGATVHLTESLTTGTWGAANGNASFVSTSDVYGLLPGIDTITYLVRDIDGCTNSAIHPLTIDAAPDAGTITGFSVVNAGSSIALSNTAGDGIWSSTNTAIATVLGTGIVYGISPGVDSAVYTVTNSCGTAMSYYKITVLPSIAGVGNTGNTDSKVLISPNPARKNFTINISSAANEQVAIVITDVAGRQLQQLTGYANQPINATIDAPTGVYLINVTGSAGSIVSKVVIE